MAGWVGGVAGGHAASLPHIVATTWHIHPQDQPRTSRTSSTSSTSRTWRPSPPPSTTQISTTSNTQSCVHSVLRALAVVEVRAESAVDCMGRPRYHRCLPPPPSYGSTQQLAACYTSLTHSMLHAWLGCSLQLLCAARCWREAVQDDQDWLLPDPQGYGPCRLCPHPALPVVRSIWQPLHLCAHPGCQGGDTR